MKVLSIISTPWRATLEEQDDTIIWLMHAIADVGAEVDVILYGDAAGYGAKGLDARGLTFGQTSQSNPPDINRDLINFLKRGRKVFICEKSLSHLGIHKDSVLPGLELVSKDKLVQLFDRYDKVWHW
ncbi:DsrE family protein [Sansalvadorimonas sp. 2012CJ34-2]|uniref:DsrE family protein n=1 Tax=Parendozoicomonas callyspongiae TaxID=2942213 RepID=A0ABT0PGM4_9GAMM|nr:DsrE family protein [Sansalvadorimonas sp. 2012CJ34-2]MCL6270519.1 DsrE family protein [Sansalvadorimonas sp. 2012CJ34-2]